MAKVLRASLLALGLHAWSALAGRRCEAECYISESESGLFHCKARQKLKSNQCGTGSRPRGDGGKCHAEWFFGCRVAKSSRPKCQCETRCLSTGVTGRWVPKETLVGDTSLEIGTEHWGPDRRETTKSEWRASVAARASAKLEVSSWHGAESLPAAPTDYTIRVKGKPQLCLNVDGGKLVQGARIILWTCSAGANEQFEFRDSDSTIRVKGKPQLCLNANSGKLARGDFLLLWTCSAAANEQFAPRWPQGRRTSLSRKLSRRLASRHKRFFQMTRRSTERVSVPRFMHGKTLWQWTYHIRDSCLNSRSSKTLEHVATRGLRFEPCCLPGGCLDGGFESCDECTSREMLLPGAPGHCHVWGGSGRMLAAAHAGPADALAPPTGVASGNSSAAAPVPPDTTRTSTSTGTTTLHV